MNHVLAVAWVGKLNHYTRKDGTELQKMVLGMEILIHNIPKLTLMIMLAALLHILPQTFAVWIPFVCIRRYASGLHASNGIVCTITTLLMFVAMPYAFQGLHISAGMLVGMFILFAFALYKYAPADTAAKPILGKKKRDKLKKKAVIASVGLLGVALVFLDELFYGLVATGAAYAVVMVLPVTYKILKRSVNNYVQYE